MDGTTKAKILLNNKRFLSLVEKARMEIGIPSKGNTTYDSVVAFFNRLEKDKKLKENLDTHTKDILREFNLPLGWNQAIRHYLIGGRMSFAGSDIWIEKCVENGVKTLKICIGRKITIKAIRNWLQNNSEDLTKKLSSLSTEPRFIKDIDLKFWVSSYRDKDKGETVSFSKISKFLINMIGDEIEVTKDVKEKDKLNKLFDSLDEESLKQNYYNYIKLQRKLSSKGK